MIDSRLSWKIHIHHVYSKIMKVTSIFYKLRQKRNSAVLKMLYFAFVHTHLLYGIEVYGNTTIENLYCLSNAILTDYLITLVSVRVSVHRSRSVVERLRPQFLTDFHQILRADQKCGCFERYCFSDKPDVVYRF